MLITLDFLLARLKILPKEVDVDLREMVDSIKRSLKEGMTVIKESHEPIAYGLVAVILDVQIPDREGEITQIEEIARSSGQVGEVEILGVSRRSTTFKVQ